MRIVLTTILTITLASAAFGAPAESVKPGSVAPPTRVDQVSSTAPDAPPRAPVTTKAQKISALKRLGFNYLEPALGPSYRLDTTNPNHARGSLNYAFSSFVYSTYGITLADFHARATINDGSPNPKVPGALLRLKSDATHNQLVDCEIFYEPLYVEFQLVNDWVWAAPPLATAVVSLAAGHAFYVLPKDGSVPWKYVRVVAGSQNAPNKFWRLRSCEITPLG